MKNGRKTTHAQRLAIVKETLKNNYSYTEASTKYQVSYQQIYTWVQKYQKLGSAGLEDRRGKNLVKQLPLTKADKEKLAAKLAWEQAQHAKIKTELLRLIAQNSANSSNNEHKYQAIFTYHREASAPIQELCRIAGVSRQAYYKWIQRQRSPRPKNQRELDNDWLETIIPELFHEFNGTYGYRRLTSEINERFNQHFGWKRIRRIMIKLGLKGDYWAGHSTRKTTD